MLRFHIPVMQQGVNIHIDKELQSSEFLFRLHLNLHLFQLAHGPRQFLVEMGSIQNPTPLSKPEILPQVPTMNPQKPNRPGWDNCIQKGTAGREKLRKKAAVCGRQGSCTTPDSIAAGSESLPVKQEPWDTAGQLEQYLLQPGRRLLFGKPDGS